MHVMPPLTTLRQQWTTEGYILVRNLFTQAEVGPLREICEEVLQQCYRNDPPHPGDGDVVMRHLNRPDYHSEHPETLAALLETAADPRILNIARAILGQEPEHRCFSLFMNPREIGRDGNWHRDTQFRPDYDEAVERERILGTPQESGIQLQLPLVPSDDAEYVPRSHLRWDTAQEYAIRLQDKQAHNQSNDMPGAIRADLQPGDVVAFNPKGLHRGRYHCEKLRRTLMLTYVQSSRAVLPDVFNNQPWFMEPGYLNGLSPQAVSFYERFVEKYRGTWTEKD